MHIAFNEYGVGFLEFILVFMYILSADVLIEKRLLSPPVLFLLFMLGLFVIIYGPSNAAAQYFPNFELAISMGALMGMLAGIVWDTLSRFRKKT